MILSSGWVWIVFVWLQTHPLDRVRRAVAKSLIFTPGLEEAVRNVPEEKWLRYSEMRDEFRNVAYDRYERKARFLQLEIEEGGADDDTTTVLKVSLKINV